MKEDKVGTATVSVADIVSLNEQVNTQKESIGSLRAQLQERLNVHQAERRIDEVIHQTKVKELEDKLEKAQKEVIINTGGSGLTERRCPACGFLHSQPQPYCRQCGYNFARNCSSIKTEFKNLDDSIALIKEELAKEYKTDVVKLQKEINDKEFEHAKLVVEFEKLEKTAEQKLTDAKSRTRERYNGMINELEKEIRNLNESHSTKVEELEKLMKDADKELKKERDNKTTREVEELRKQEIVDLKEAVTKVEKVFEGEKAYGYFKQIWFAITGKTKFAIRKAAIVELEETRNRVNEISNQYPKVKTYNHYWDEVNDYFTNKKNKWVDKLEKKASGILYAKDEFLGNPF